MIGSPPEEVFDCIKTVMMIIIEQAITKKNRIYLKIGKKPAGESVEIYINGRIVGKGEVMVYEKNLAIRVNEVLDSNAIIYYLTRESISTT